jgi:hypothetical protein
MINFADGGTGTIQGMSTPGNHPGLNGIEGSPSGIA